MAGPTAIESVAISPDGARVAGGAADGTLFVWDTSTSQLVGPPLTGHTVDGTALAFSPDGSVLASGGRDTNVVLWNAATVQAIGQPLRGHSNSVFTLAFNSDGRVLASGGADATVRMWDVASGAPIGTLDNGAWVTSVVFKPDDPNVLVSAGLDGWVWQWDVSLSTWQQRAGVIAGRDLTEQEWRRYVGDEPYRATCSTLARGG